MEKETLVTVEHVAKKFCRDLKTSLWYGVKDLGAEFFGGQSGDNIDLRKKEFWAVKDVNFELRRGECLGLIGRNGAGKSTLLKMLNGLIKPDRGRIEMRGRIGALIELGSGFNPILTGRENIYNNGAVLGLTKRDIKAVLDEIIDFSEMEEFIDTPVQYYSSGMKVRLGFSVAAHMKPDVLILDEVLAVGDSGFKIKSFNKINEIMREAAVIFVSHSMPHIATITNKVLLMENGVVDYYGHNITDGIEQYFNLFEGDRAKVEFDEYADLTEMVIHSSSCYADDTNRKNPTIDYRDAIRVDMSLRVKPEIADFSVKLQITDKDLKIVGIYESAHFQAPITNDGDLQTLKIKIPDSLFIDGEYAVTIFIQQREPHTAKNKLLGVYRYWRKFNMKATKGLGVVPAVVYLPGELVIIAP